MPAPQEKNFPIDRVARILDEETRRWKTPIVTAYAQKKREPFKALISTILSLRTKDDTTEAATARLWKLARSPRGMLKLDEARIAETIYPVGFYKTKAETILKISRILIDEHGGKVPDDLDTLLALPGVGRKTANLVLTQGYGIDAICVDTHVHRITNRWGYLETKTPEDTEMRLRAILPRKYWIPINDWLVAYGQNLCHPTSPKCSLCRLAELCERRGVKRSR